MRAEARECESTSLLRYWTKGQTKISAKQKKKKKKEKKIRVDVNKC